MLYRRVVFVQQSQAHYPCEQYQQTVRQEYTTEEYDGFGNVTGDKDFYDDRGEHREKSRTVGGFGKNVREFIRLIYRVLVCVYTH